MEINNISVERLLSRNLDGVVNYGEDIVLVNHIGSFYPTPMRIEAISIVVCTGGECECSINLRRYLVRKNCILICSSNDIIQIHRTSDDMDAFAVLISIPCIRELQIDPMSLSESIVNFFQSAVSEINDGERIAMLKPYMALLAHNIETKRMPVLKNLLQAFLHTVWELIRQSRQSQADNREGDTRPHARQIFNRFMALLTTYHTSERSIKFYADKLFLTPKYISYVVKKCSGKSALDWINQYVVLEAKNLIANTDLTIQEIAYKLNFPSQSAFGKYFRSQAGLSPRQYRQQSRSEK